MHVHLLVHVLGLIACGSPLLAQERVGPVVTSLTIFAGTETGLWRSSDWGYRWEKVQGTDRGDSLKEVGPVRSILALGPKVYIGAETGLYVSEDFGQTWTRTSLTTPVTAVLPSRYPLSDPTLFAGTSTGLLKSVDAAKTFLPTAIRDAAVYRLEWPGPALIAATGRGVLVSKDAATNADALGTGLPPGEVRALAVSSYFMVDPVMFAGVGAAGVHRSRDGGKTWSPSGLEGQAVTDLAWLGPILFAVSDKGLFRSEDAGKTWTPLGEGLKGVTPARLMFPLAPDSAAEAFVGTDRGVFRTNDGGLRWLKAGLDEERVLCLGTFPPPDKPQKVRKH